MSLAALAALPFMALAGIGIAYLLLSAVLVLRHAPPASPRRSGERRGEAAPSMTVLKPLHGAEEGLLDNLLSFCRQDYAGEVRLVFGVQRADDPAIAVVEELRRLRPELTLDLVVDPRQHGTNRKVSNLVNMARLARGDVVVLADSDMRVGPDYLARLAAALAEPGVGAVTCLYHGLPVGPLPSRLAALGIDTHFLPSVVAGVALGLAKPCMGSTIALRRETLERVGGFARVADALADDYEIGAAVRALGLAVAVPPLAIGHVCPERTLGSLVAQELRWVRTVRQIDPAGHAGSLATHPLAFALAAVALAPGAVTWMLLFTAIGARLALCLAVERSFGLKPHPYWLVPVRDALSFALFVASFFGRGVVWRGHRYDVARSGALRPRGSSPATRPDPT